MKHFREIERLLTVYIVQLLCIAKGTAGMGVKQLEVISWLTLRPEKLALYETPSLQTPLIWTDPVEQEKPQYTEEELERDEKR